MVNVYIVLKINHTEHGLKKKKENKDDLYIKNHYGKKLLQILLQEETNTFVLNIYIQHLHHVIIKHHQMQLNKIIEQFNRRILT